MPLIIYEFLTLASTTEKSHIVNTDRVSEIQQPNVNLTR